MPTFTILILVCAIGVSRTDCQPETAVATIRGPQVQNELMCGFFGQATLAGTAVAPREGLEYMKIMCLRSKTTAARGLPVTKASLEADGAAVPRLGRE